MRINWEIRQKIEQLYEQGKSQKEIALIVGVSEQTLCHEIKRGLKELKKSSGKSIRRYYAEEGQQDYERQQSRRNKNKYISKEARDYIEKEFTNKSYPKAIIIDAQEKFAVSRATAYRYIRSLKQKEEKGHHSILKTANKLYIDGRESEAFKLYLQGKKIGDESCIHRVAECFYRGSGVEQDFRQAFQNFLKSARLGNPESMWWAGYLLDNGIGIGLDLNQAYYWYRKSAEAGSENGMVYLAFFYEHGVAMTRDLLEAARWYKKAKGNIYAQKWLEENEEKVIQQPDQIVSHTVEEYKNLYQILTNSMPSDTLIEQAIASGEISEVIGKGGDKR